MEKQNSGVQIQMESFEYGLEGAHERQGYIRALRGEMASAAEYANDHIVDSVCITGTNPLQYRGETVAEVVTTLANILELEKKADITVLSLPGFVNYGDLLFMKDHGVTRISFDMQTFIQSELDALGRTYATRAMEVFANMVHRKMVFFDFDIQLGWGLPGQTEESLRFSLEQAMRLQPTHITLSPYTKTGGRDLPSFYSIASNAILESNMVQYTPFHFARPGYECRYNKTAYANRPRIGFGAGGCWKIDGLCCQNTSDAAAYIQAEGFPEKTIVQMVPITQEDVDLSGLKDALYTLNGFDGSLATPNIKEKINALLEAGYLEEDQEKIRLTAQGLCHWPAVDTALGK